jgi:hypothetical protein
LLVACWRHCDLHQEQRNIVVEPAARVGGQPVEQPVRGCLKRLAS